MSRLGKKYIILIKTGIFMTARDDLKILLVKEHITLTELASIATSALNKKYTVQSLSQKLVRGTMPYDELERLVRLLGYKINFEKF